MKKTVLFALTLVALVCTLAMAVSAEVVEYDDFGNRTTVPASTNDLVVFDDGFTCPSAYIVKDQGDLAFDFNYIKGKTGVAYNLSMVVELDIPEGVTYLATYALKGGNVPRITKVSIPKTVTSMSNSIFEKASTLEECVFEHTADSKLTKLSNWTFQGCTSLRAISLPDCITELGNTEFSACTSLGALYLPRGLERINSSTGTSATFYGCTSMFFVEEPFTYANVPTTAPSIYCFPSTLTYMAGETFKNCTYLKNSVLVFPEGITTIDNGWRFANNNETNSQIRRKIVFLGNVTEFTFSSECKYTDFYFVNSATTKDTVNFVSKGTPTSCNVYICNGATYSALPTNNNSWNTENYAHLVESTERIKATCTENASAKSVCFCGFDVGTTVVENSALGHDFENGAVVYTFGATLYDSASSCIACVRNCGATSNATEVGVVIEEKGYSSCDIGGIKSFTRGYYVNTELLAIYEEQTGTKVVIGFAFARAEKVDTTDGVTLGEFSQNMVLKEADKTLVVNNLDYIIRYKNDTYVDAMVVIAGYYTVGEETVFSSVESVSYNSIAKQGNVTVTPEGDVDISVDIGTLLGWN